MPLDRAKSKKGLARSNGQDLMRGEHVVGDNRNKRANALPSGGGGGGWKKMNEDMQRNREKLQGRTTWVAGPRDQSQLDETSRKILAAGGQGQEASGTSIFDPVLTELAYRWFCPEGGKILDPFAGGSVRGIVAAFLGYQYTGVDLSGRQLEANEEQAQTILSEGNPKPIWIAGDSQGISKLAPGQYDFVFSCPPYGDLEVYSEDPRDLSTKTHAEFLKAFRSIVSQCVAMLKADRFGCFVVGDFRDARGFYRNFVASTVAAFQDAGAMLYNDAVLVTAVGSLPIRVGKQFGAYRKLGKTHQNVLVFCKGDSRRASRACALPEDYASAMDQRILEESLKS
jgi:16S rRNA G966 N2-methylase RsmD